MANKKVSLDEVRRSAKDFVTKAVANEGKPALLGRANGQLYLNSTSRDLIWVRVGEGDSPNELVARISISAPRELNLPVRVALRDGELTVIGVDSTRVSSFTGGAPLGMIEHAASHGRFGNDPLYITGGAFLPLMARPSSPAALTVTVEAGFYRYLGTQKAFAQTVSGSFSSYLPIPTRQTFVVLYLNRATNALGIAASGVNIVSSATVAPFSVATVLAAVETLSLAYFPIAAIRLFYGQTRIMAQDIFMDVRQWGGEPPLTPETVTAISYDYDFIDPVNGETFDHGEASGDVPDGWIEQHPAVPSTIADGYWKLHASPSETEITYHKQTPFDLESGTKFVTFGPLLIADNFGDDTTWQVGVHSHASGVYNSLVYVHIVLSWDSSAGEWSAGIVHNDGTTPVVETAFVLPGPPLTQPIYITIEAQLTRFFRCYVGHTKNWRGCMTLGLIDLSATPDWGEFWVEVKMLRPSATTYSWLYVGGVDYVDFD